MPRHRSLHARRGRVPLTLFDGSSLANLATGLEALAGAVHPRSAGWAEKIQKAAAQARAGYTAAQAATAWAATVPVYNDSFTEGAFTEYAWVEWEPFEPTDHGCPLPSVWSEAFQLCI